MKRRRLRIRRRSVADQISVNRAHLASAFDLLRRALEGQLLQHYAAKLAGLRLCLKPNEFRAAADRLQTERDAAVERLRNALREEERAQAEASSRQLTCSRDASDPLRMPTRVAEFTMAAQEVTHSPAPNLRRRRPVRRRRTSVRSKSINLERLL
jgi:hypothetical protein